MQKNMIWVSLSNIIIQHEWRYLLFASKRGQIPQNSIMVVFMCKFRHKGATCEVSRLFWLTKSAFPQIQKKFLQKWHVLDTKSIITSEYDGIIVCFHDNMTLWWHIKINHIKNLIRPKLVRLGQDTDSHSHTRTNIFNCIMLECESLASLSFPSIQSSDLAKLKRIIA